LGAFGRSCFNASWPCPGEAPPPWLIQGPLVVETGPPAAASVRPITGPAPCKGGAAQPGGIALSWGEAIRP
jgi:hypothetical protein